MSAQGDRYSLQQAMAQQSFATAMSAHSWKTANCYLCGDSGAVEVRPKLRVCNPCVGRYGLAEVKLSETP